MHSVSRLINSFIPNHYDLSLTLQRKKRAFRGTVTIHGQMTPQSQAIIVHAKDLVVSSVVIDGKSAEFHMGENDELSLSNDSLKSGKHIVVISFSGTITDPMHGLYPCYFEHDGVKKELLATQFESHHAREVFPCIDEPEAKATFDVTLTTEPDITVLGNMPVKKQGIEQGQLVTVFERTPRMSTYLVAWVTGELHGKSAVTKNDVVVTIWATPAQSHSSLDFALDSAVRSIEFYEEYFDTPYPLPKSDHVALPDFSSGAMENWGLITYRETTLLADPQTTGISTKQLVASVISHELAHQWFGNLVTMKWWNDLWLNESFATLMSYFALDALYPEWNIWLDFTAGETISALRRDSIDGVQSVQIDVNHPDEISTLFDGAIVYAKGARLLAMLQHYVGTDAFQQGLKRYFGDHAYKNTEAIDLWSAIESVTDKPIVSLMDSWLSQPGYPVVHVTQVDELVTLSQDQFFTGPHEPSSRLWPIPLNSSCNEMPEIFDTKTMTVARHHTTPLRFNIGDTAHFITHYSPEILRDILRAMESGALSTIDRVQLLHEATLLARGGILPSSNLLSLISAYKNETHEQVWTIVSVALSELRKFVEQDDVAERKLRTLSADIARQQYERLGWTMHVDEPEDDTKLRSTIIGLMLYGEDTKAIQTARSIYDSSRLEDLDPELRPLIISSVVRNADATIVDTLFNTYTSSQSGELQQDICVGITSTRIPEKILFLLNNLKDSSLIRPQDAAHWFVFLVRGRDSQTLAWQWLQDNWQWVIDTFSGDKSYDDYVRYTAGALNTSDQLDQYRTFFIPKQDIPALSRAIAMGIKEIEGRVELIERDKKSVRSALLDL